MLRIVDCDSTMLTECDIEDGYVDCVFYEVWYDCATVEEAVTRESDDGGMLVYEYYIHDRYESLAGVIPDALGMAGYDKPLLIPYEIVGKEN